MSQKSQLLPGAVQSSAAAESGVEEEIFKCLAAEYGLTAVRLTTLAVSPSSAPRVFRIETDAGPYFLKLKRDVPAAGIAVSRLLSNRKIAVSAPLSGRSGAGWAPVDDLVLLVFPFLHAHPVEMSALGRTGCGSLGALLHSVHASAIPEELERSLDRETFTPYGAESLKRIHSRLAESVFEASSFQGRLAQLWTSLGALPEEFLPRVSAKGEAAIRSHPLYCLCHGDFQPGNILRSASGELTLVDWDSTVWSPPEIDLMFVAPRVFRDFKQGYGTISVNECVLEYLKLNWLLQEALDFVDRLLFATGVGMAEARWAFESLTALLPRMRAAMRRA